jgi:hypothetical protein
VTVRLEAAVLIVNGLSGDEQAKLVGALVGTADAAGAEHVGRALAERLLELAAREPAAVSNVVGALMRIVRDLSIGLAPLPVAPLVDEVTR